MKKTIAFLAFVLLILLLCACNGGKTLSQTNTDGIENIGNGIPVISITTNNTSKDALDFVTKPVAGFVAEQIASWTPDYVMPPEPYYEECKITVTDESGRVTLAGVDGQVKVRGNWTTTYAKKPLRLKFTEKQSLLGLNDGAEMKNWVLTAEYKDGSMLRNKTTFAIADEILSEDNLYTADACFVEVVINGKYWGVYLLTDYQQINENRVNITEAEEGYTGTDIGYFLEFDAYNYTNESPLQSFDMNYADLAPLVPFDGEGGSGRTIVPEKAPGFTIKNDIYSQEQHDFIASFIDNVYRIMYAAAYEDKAYVFNADYSAIVESDTVSPREAVEMVVDVNSLADMYIVSELACDADIYWSSFYMDVDFGEEGNKKLTFEAPWDYDSALGNKDRCVNGIGFYAAGIIWDVNDEYESINPWLAVLAYEDWLQELVSEKWTKAYDDGVFERAYTMIKEDTVKYKDAFDRNYAKWNNILNRSEFGYELSLLAARCHTHKQASDHLLEWLTTRVEFLNEHWHK